MENEILWTRRRALSAASSAAALIAAPLARAQDSYPSRPLRMIVGYPPGGIADILGRACAVEAEKKLGQPIAIINRPGAAGVISFLAIKNAPPDGYTIGSVNTAVWRQPVLEDVAYDPLKDFSYVLNLYDFSFAVVVAANSPFRTWPELLAWGRANMQKASYAVVPGLGQSTHLFVEEIAAREKVTWQAVPYNGAADAINAMLGGHVTFGVLPVLGTNNLVRGGKARFLATTTDERLKSFADVPTMTELGYGLKIDSTSGIAGPAGLSPQVVKTLHDAFKFALEQPAVLAAIEDADQRSRYMGTENYKKYIAQSSIEQRELLTRYGFAKKR